MHRECSECVASDEPDIHSKDRVAMRLVEQEMRILNQSLTSKDGVVVVSDTQQAARLATSLLSATTVAAGWEEHARRAVHSTQIDDLASANDLVAGFVLMAIADELVRLGDSSLSGCAQSLAGRSG